MNTPLLVVVTGRPASGKSTLAHILAKEIKCPLLSRDELKEGYINTLGLSHSQADNSVAQHIYNTFFEAIDLFIAKGISVIVEAAFQDKLWKPKLLGLQDKAVIRIVICTTTTDVAKSRFIDRLQNDPGREKFHGDHLVKEQGGLLTSVYDPVNIDAPILEVDTTQQYNPDIEKIIRFIKQENSR
jgi:predicted kinase